MNPIKKLAGQTVIYGLSSVVPRFLSYLLVPLYTYAFKPEEYGIVGDLYSWVVLLNIVVTYGMETAYFWFSKNEKNVEKVYSTALISLVSTSVLFIFLSIIFSSNLANTLNYENNAEYIWWFGVIIGLDAMCSIPFVKLRRENKAFRFALIKLMSVGVNILFNLIFVVFLPWLKKTGVNLPLYVYNESIGVGYIFLSNIFSSLFTFLFLLKDFKVKFSIDFALLKKMLRYALPLLFAGLAGAINDVIDRQFIKYYSPEGLNSLEQLGIYFANAKIAVVLVVFIQTFRFAAEPFFFNYEKEKDAKTVFADIMNYFVIFCIFIFIGTYGNLPWIKYFIGDSYWSGLSIVPVILIANFFVGVYLNLSIWYKLSGKTYYGAYIISIGAALTILINFLFVPMFGYVASAYARLVCYIAMTGICYFLGIKYYHIPYNLRRLFLYCLPAVFISIVISILSSYSVILQLVINNLLLLLFIAIVVYTDGQLKNVLLSKLKRKV